MPDDDTIDETPPGGYGEKVESEDITFSQNIDAFAFGSSVIYVERSHRIVDIFDFQGTLITAGFIDLSNLTANPLTGFGRPGFGYTHNLGHEGVE